jgi:uncharacterized protein (TIGR00369 family)
MTDFNSNLGLRLGDDGQSVELDTRPEHQVAPGTVHFAVLATLAEVSAAQAVGAPVVPATVHLNLMSRAQPGRLRGVGTVLKRGRRLTVAEGLVQQEDKTVAKATVTFAMV